MIDITEVEWVLEKYHFEQADAFDILSIVNSFVPWGLDQNIDEEDVMDFLESILEIIALAYDTRDFVDKEELNMAYLSGVAKGEETKQMKEWFYLEKEIKKETRKQSNEGH